MPDGSSSFERAAARLTEKVDLPTPPFPLATAMTYLTPLIFAAAGAPCCADWAFLFGVTVTLTSTRSTPDTLPMASSMSSRILEAIELSEVDIAMLIVAFPFSRLADRTRPKDTMSRLKPGYLIVLRAAWSASWLTVVSFVKLFR